MSISNTLAGAPTDTKPERRSRSGLPISVALGIAWLVAMVLVAAFADQIRPFDITMMDLTHRLSPPGGLKHLLGTD